jgi:hypothetical protein
MATFMPFCGILNKKLATVNRFFNKKKSFFANLFFGWVHWMQGNPFGFVSKSFFS